jgi:mRNA-degrading endonuclease toxin of MazEF toxin-antitoxin module
VAVIDQIHAVTKHRFKSRIAIATQDELKDIGRALREVLSLEP